MEDIQDRDTSKRTIRNPIGAKDAKNIIQDSLYSSKVFDILEGETFGKERTLLKLGQKFYPVKKYAVNLDEMTAANRNNYLKGDRKWYMKVEGLFRDAVEREVKDTGEVLEQDFCNDKENHYTKPLVSPNLQSYLLFVDNSIRNEGLHYE